jgi:CO/xanthine dehydrogenase Mo-binding subunit
MTVPANLVANPTFDRWLDWRQPGRLRLMTGKVELGQGITTALAQIAADALDLAVDQIDVVAGDTRVGPDEWYTAGSVSIESSGAAVSHVCSHARMRLVDAFAAVRRDTPGERDVVRGELRIDGEGTGLTCWDVAGDIDWTGPIPADEPPLRARTSRSVPRIDLARKLTGGAFIHDFALSGMRHARVVRCPYRDGVPAIDEAVRRDRHPEVDVIVRGCFVAVVADREEDAVAAAAGAERLVRWRSEHPARLADAPERPGIELLSGRTVRRVVVERDAAPAAAEQQLDARYTRSFIAHASIGPACALAWLQAGVLTVWSHSQGVFALRGQLARLAGAEVTRVDVVHLQGAGCYGHNGADDAAAEAALIAIELAGVPVRLQWSRAEEFGAAPAGSAMTVDLRAALAGNRIVDWSLTTHSGNHGRRPGWEGRLNLPVAALVDATFAEAAPECDVAPAAGGGGDRNAAVAYRFGGERAEYFHLPEVAVRTSSLRTLGAFANVFAIESFLDEIAAALDEDALALRLRHLEDERARHVLERVAARIDWSGRQAVGEGTGKGLAFARYKNKAAYLAAAAEVVLEETVRVVRLACVVDCGFAVNPDGVANQIEGGALQAMSWTLFESLAVSDSGVLCASWEQYPILGFADVPEVIVDIVSDPARAPLGVGEAAAGPVAAALGNAISTAVGVRLRDLPLSRERIVQALV